MAVIKGIELYWVVCTKDEPRRYEGKGPAKWSVQLRVNTKQEAKDLGDQYGFDFKPFEKDDGKLGYKTTISRFAYRQKEDGSGEDLENFNKPVTVVLGNGEPVDPSTVGNGSIGNISFTFKKDKSSRTLVGIQLTKHIVFNKEPEFDFTEAFEVVNPDSGDDKVDDIF